MRKDEAPDAAPRRRLSRVFDDLARFAEAMRHRKAAEEAAKKKPMVDRKRFPDSSRQNLPHLHNELRSRRAASKVARKSRRRNRVKS